MNISLVAEEKEVTESFISNDLLEDNVSPNNSNTSTINYTNKIQNYIKQNQSSKLLMPVSNGSIYSRDITNRLTLSSLNPNSIHSIENKGVKRSQSIHTTPTSSLNRGYLQTHSANNFSSYRNSFIYSNRLNIIKDDLDGDRVSPNENENLISSTTSNNDSSASSASVSVSSSSSPSSLSAIYSNVGRGFTLKKKNYDNKNLSLINKSNNHKIERNEQLITDLLKNHSNFIKPIPPNRTSSLNYKYNPQLSQYNNENIYDRNSIYSTYSIRNSSCLSALNFNNNSATHHNDYALRLLDKNEIFRIESCYKSIGSNVHSCKCSAELYSTNLQNLIKLLDWKHQLNGVPVWVFNTGNNPKRPKSLSLVIAEKKTGFALWRLNSITYLNDLKWTKPGHVTFKVFSNNLNPMDNSFDSHHKNKKTPKKSKLSQSKTNSNISSMNNDKALTFRSSISFNDMKYINDTFNEYSDFNQLIKNPNNYLTDANKPFVFAAIKFDNDFECTRFYDFYRLLFNNSKNDDLFNPNYKPTNNNCNSAKTNLFHSIYKKIAKNSISSPCAFHHINSLSILDENDHDTNRLESISDNQSILSTSDTTTITSHNDSSIIYNENNHLKSKV